MPWYMPPHWCGGASHICGTLPLGLQRIILVSVGDEDPKTTTQPTSRLKFRRSQRTAPKSGRHPSQPKRSLPSSGAAKLVRTQLGACRDTWKEPKKRRGGRNHRGVVPPWAEGTDGRRVYVRGFDFDTPEDLVRSHCERVGTVKNCSLISQGSALVEYATELDAQEAVTHLTGTVIDGNTWVARVCVCVSFAIVDQATV